MLPMLEYRKAQHGADQSEAPRLTVVLVRHAQPRATETDMAQDPDLTTRGRHQATRVAHRLANWRFKHIYISDLTRAFRTGEAIRKHHARTPFTVTPLIREVSHHHFTNAVTGADAEEMATIHREKANIQAFADLLLNQHRPGQTVCVVGHGNFIRSFIPVFAGIPPESAIMLELYNASVTVMDRWGNGHAVLRLANCVKHLKEKDVT
jgi:broad specificity phosphatase PhoE